LTGTKGKALSCVPIKWKHLIGTQLKIKDLAHVKTEKVGQLFRDMD